MATDYSDRLLDPSIPDFSVGILTLSADLSFANALRSNLDRMYGQGTAAVWEWDPVLPPREHVPNDQIIVVFSTATLRISHLADSLRQALGTPQGQGHVATYIAAFREQSDVPTSISFSAIVSFAPPEPQDLAFARLVDAIRRSKPAGQQHAPTQQVAESLGSSAELVAIPRIFVSHSSADNEFGLRLVADLRLALGDEHSVWYDASGGLGGGDIWWDQIVMELTERQVFIVVLSPDAVASKWVQDEVRLAWQQRNSTSGKVIIPVMLRPCDVPRILRLVQYVWFIPPRPYEDAFSELLAAVSAGESREAALDRPPEIPQGPPFDEALLPAADRLVGRESDLSWVLDRLQAGSAAAISAIEGLGGIGKTALAAQAVKELRRQQRFSDGVAVVQCQGMDDPLEVLRRALARFEPYRRTPEIADGSTAIDAARRILNGRDTLVVLDNVEPSLVAEQVIIPLRTAGASVLVTARHQLPPAAVSPNASRILQLLSSDEALELFAVSFAKGGPAYLSPSERTAAMRIVEALGRHTLAVKLAGAYAAADSRDLGVLATELEEPQQAIDLLPEGEMPHAVAKAFVRSIEALPRDAQRFFSALAAFPTGEFGRSAALSFGEGMGFAASETYLHLLIVRAVVDASLDASMPEGSDRERLRLHPLLRSLAAAHFQTWPQERRLSSWLSVSDYYCRYVRNALDAALAKDENNIIGSLDWASASGHKEAEATLGAGMWQYWRARSRTQDRLRYLKRCLEAADAIALSTGERSDGIRAAQLTLAYGEFESDSGNRQGAGHLLIAGLRRTRELFDRPGEGVALTMLGELARARGHIEEAQGYFREALTIRREVGDRRGAAMTLSFLGEIAELRGNVDTARKDFQEALTIRREVGDRPGEAVELSYLGELAMLQGDLPQAEHYFDQSLPIRRELGDRRGEGVDLNFLGQVARMRGHLEDAKAYFAQSLAIDIEMADRPGEGVDLSYLGQIALLEGQLVEAQDFFNRCTVVMREVEDRPGEGVALANLGRLALLRGDLLHAEALYLQSLEIRREVQHRRGEGVVLSYLGEVALLRGEIQRAQHYFEQALQIHEEAKDRRSQGVDIDYLGWAAQVSDKLEQAQTLYRQALTIHREVQNESGEARTLFHVASTAAQMGDYQAAVAAYRQSLTLATEAHSKQMVADAESGLGQLLIEHLGQAPEGCRLMRQAADKYAEMGVPQAREARELLECYGCDTQGESSSNGL